MNELIISQKYPEEKYNLLGNTAVMVNIPDIKSPVIQVITINTNPNKGEVYIQQKAYKDRDGNSYPDKYALTKNGLKKLADGAGIKMISSEHVIPTTCQKCVAINQSSGKVVQCGNCKNRDVAYRVTIAVPQLTGDVLTVEDTNEVIVDNVIPSMTEKQAGEFLKHLPQICEAKALNGAIRTALHIKGTYTLEELKKPFVVAYLVPNLDNAEVKQIAISNMFNSTSNLFGAQVPTIQQIESKAPDTALLETSNNEVIDSFIDETYVGNSQSQPKLREQQEENRNDFFCDKCGNDITEKVWRFSIDKYERPLCYKCQKGVGRQ